MLNFFISLLASVTHTSKEITPMTATGVII